MKIKITVVRTGHPLEMAVPPSSELPFFSVYSTDELWAEIIKDGEACNGEFLLQVGRDPDCRGYVDLGAGNLQFTGYDYLNKMTTRLKLFNQTIGESYLYLIDRGAGGRFIPIARVEVKNKGKEHLYQLMVEDLLSQRLPHYVVDDFKGQMKKNHFAFDWRNGYASYDRPEEMLDLLEKILHRVYSLVSQISRTARMNVVSTRVSKKIDRVSRVDIRGVRQLEAAMNRLGAQDLPEMSGSSISSSMRLSSFYMPVHSAIAWFLRGPVRSRLERIIIACEEAIAEIKMRMSKNRLETKYKQNDFAGNSAEINEHQRRMECARRLVRIVDEMLAYPIFSVVDSGVTVYDVDAIEFSANDSYRKLYKVMMDFLKMRFWWVHDKDEMRRRIPQVQFDEFGETRWQRKYSMVYEYWCYARLCKAAEGLGVRHQLGRFRIGGVARCHRYVVHDHDVEIFVFHEITARANKKSNGDVFRTCSYRDITPDFALLVRGNGRTAFWSVLDAKSDNGIKPHFARVHDKYRTVRCFADGCGDDGVPADAVVLFVSAENERNGDAGIDFPVSLPQECLDRNESEWEDRDIWANISKEDCCWRDGEGICQGLEAQTPCHGHVRANVKSIKSGDDVFQRFLKGVIATALRKTELADEWGSC